MFILKDWISDCHNTPDKLPNLLLTCSFFEVYVNALNDRICEKSAIVNMTVLIARVEDLSQVFINSYPNAERQLAKCR